MAKRKRAKEQTASQNIIQKTQDQTTWTQQKKWQFFH